MKTGDKQALEWLRCALGLAGSQAPFPWQIELLRRFREGEAVSSLDIPTGLGKTAVMAVWLVARALGASLPRRLVYVVDRRAVVDQATAVAETLRAWVAKEPEVAEALGLDDRGLPISTLRGQHVDNRAWLEDPSSPAIIVGTVDMVGSRLLFSGYVSSKMRPYHAGLLGADALVVLDEAHLVPAFEDLLRQVERGADAFGPQDTSLRALVPPFQVLSLSATGRQLDAATLTLSGADRLHPIVAKRLAAKKTLRIVDLAPATKTSAGTDEGVSADEADEAPSRVKGPTLVEELARHAWQLTEQGSARVRCLVFCDSRKDALAVASALRKLKASTGAPPPIFELFVGARRVLERTMVAKWLVDHGFVEREDGTRAEPQGPTFLVATSAGEVGVDMDADHMVCDLVAWERMIQRLGRVNRRGDGDAKVVVVVDREPAPSDRMTTALKKSEASDAAKVRVDELTKDLHALQGAKASIPKGQKASTDAKATEEKRKQAVKELKQSISVSQRSITAFKDADAKAVASHNAEVARHRALRKLLDTVAEGGGCLSPEALLKLRDRPDLTDALSAAKSAEPLRPELTRALVDAWSMTSLDEHPGRPDVDPWLRGFRPNDPPQTTVVWRRHLPVQADGPLDPKAAKRFFDAAPPHTSEQLEADAFVVREWLSKRAGKLLEANGLATGERIAAVGLSTRGEVKQRWTRKELDELKALKNEAAKQFDVSLTSLTLVVDAELGGLTHGLLDLDSNAIAAASDDCSSTWLARPDVADVPVTGFRIRELGANEEDESAWRTTPGAGWVRRYVFVTKMVDGEPSAALAIDGWAGDAATEEERAEANHPQKLGEHQALAVECARQIAARLGIGAARTYVLVLSARLHDEGKQAGRWQRAFKAPIEGRPYAKTKGPIDFHLLDGYRHELGSLPCVEAHGDFKALGTDDQDSVLHLVAAHHGFARPVIETSGCDDAPPSIVSERARAIALRSARLSRLWGPWGLAWWEAILRSADQTASRRNQQAAIAQKEQP
ncbi:MAG: type I-U CRISPR-associated helicase/endonuclease Cas3 [Gemmatimonadaceae bacterium]|nr:type I-U CRISPR-associated helicase/endonuclease Cas3 [Gemmatimonadaceae bacterium]